MVEIVKYHYFLNHLATYLSANVPSGVPWASVAREASEEGRVGLLFKGSLNGYTDSLWT